MISTRRTGLAALIALLAVHVAAASEPPAGDQFWIPGEFVLAQADAIRLDDGQKQVIAGAIQQAQAAMQRIQATLQAQVGATLSEAQRQQLARMPQELAAFAQAQHERQAVQERFVLTLRAKVEQVMGRLQALQMHGGDPAAFAPDMTRLKAVMDAGHPEEGMAILDDLLARLAP